jgi:ABC-type nickel/cobalt efflux system permease component RcnA
MALAGFFNSAPALAHPLGNFSVNRFVRLEVAGGALGIHYVLDKAEIPSFQELGVVNADPEAYASRRATEVLQGLELRLDGRFQPVRLIDRRLTQLPGQGGLPTLRLEINYVASLADYDPGRLYHVTFFDRNEPDRPGWREITALARGNARIGDSDVPSQGVSDELRSYPADLFESPLDRRNASFSFRPGDTSGALSPLGAARPGPMGAAGGLANLLTGNHGSVFGTLAVLALAFGFGALHALGPGHGKTVMAAYVASSRSRPRDTLFLGLIVSLMHTVSVLGLGLVLLRLDRSFSADRLYPFLTLTSGLVVMVVGVRFLVRSRGGEDANQEEQTDGHGHNEAPHFTSGHHHRAHTKGIPHQHHLHEGVPPLSRKGLVALGSAGGLLPSPSALVVLLSAFTLHRVALGLAIIAAFSLGLAATLTAVGIMLVYGRSVVEDRRVYALTNFLPMLGAVGLVLVGITLVFRGAQSLV